MQQELKSVLITGANSGIGKEVARQLALRPSMEKVYLACRNKRKAEAAKQDLEQTTQKFLFEIISMDMSDASAVRSSLKSLPGSVDGLVMNAGGQAAKRQWL